MLLFLLCLLLSLLACQAPPPPSPMLGQPLFAPRYAKGFSAYTHAQGQVLLLHAPQADTLRYLLRSQNQAPCPQGFVCLPLPLERVLLSGSAQVAFIQALGRGSAIKGMSNADFIYDSTIYAAVQKGQIANLGQQQAFNFEKALGLKAQLLFSLPQESKNSQRLSALGLPSLPIAEYLEDHPLGRAEWLLVFGLLFDALPEAQQQFDQTRQAYEALQQRIAALTTAKPLVLVGNAYDGLWYAAGGKSFLATFIRDAGGLYPWADNQDSGGLPLEPEQVYALAPKFDFWLNVGTNQTLAQLQSLDPRQAKIRAWQAQQVYNYDARISPNGGYDIFESALVQPHRVLEDLYRIFHEKANSDLYYYRKLP